MLCFLPTNQSTLFRQQRPNGFEIGLGESGVAPILRQMAQQVGEGMWLPADKNNAESMLMREFKGWIELLQLFPQAPYPEATPKFVSVVENNHASFRHLRQPSLEIVLHRLVGMQAINMKQVNRAVFKVAQRRRKI